jgi:hypothetical protein
MPFVLLLLSFLCSSAGTCEFTPTLSGYVEWAYTVEIRRFYHTGCSNILILTSKIMDTTKIMKTELINGMKFMHMTSLIVACKLGLVQNLWN